MLEKHYRIEAPDTEGFSFDRLLNDSNVMAAVDRAQERYLHWQELKHKSWVPDDKKAFWGLLKAVRRIYNANTPIVDENGTTYKFNPRLHVEFLHEVDLELGGSFLGIDSFSEGDRRRIIRRNLIEESIASSQLEGANTSRSVAKKMLAEGRKPRDRGEQMIANNHATMKSIEEYLKYEEMSIDLLFDLHRQITHDTIPERHQGVIRNTFDEKGNPLVIKPWDDLTIAYVAPSRDFVEKQLPRFVAFANNDDHGVFIHPLLKAIMLHFWIGLIHPFEDGNGRLARIIFYWYMLKKQYWAFSYLSISERIVKSPKQYAMAFIYSEQDDGDLNYFTNYNIAKIKLARRAFKSYVISQIEKNRKRSELIRSNLNINERQINLLQYLSKDEQRYTTLREHQNVNDDIGKVTASKDLQSLVEKGFLEKIKRGRNVYYYPTSKVVDLF